jgi:hypothetical protein
MGTRRESVEYGDVVHARMRGTKKRGGARGKKMIAYVCSQGKERYRRE